MSALIHRGTTGARTSVTCNAIGASLTTAGAGSGLRPGVRRLNPAVLKEFQRVCQRGHLRYCTISCRRSARRPGLSPPRTEVLAWVARGKEQPADILGIPDVVRGHVV